MKRKAKKEPEQPVEQQTLQENQPAAPAYTQNIPDDEIWTFQVEGLPAPKIGKNHHHDRWRKVLVVAVLLVAISLSMFFSVRTVHNDEYEFVQLDSGEYMLDKYANPGGVKEVTLDYVDGDRQNRWFRFVNLPLTAMSSCSPFISGKMYRKLTANPFTAAGRCKIFMLTMQTLTIVILTAFYIQKI